MNQEFPVPTAVTLSRLICISVLLASPAIARAAADCSFPQTQHDMNECADDAYRQVDEVLNSSFQKLIHKISPAGQAKLYTAEKAWIAYRDSQCAFNTMATEGGSIHHMVLADCLSDLTKQQTAQLEAQRNCQEDVSCGGQ
jgi:uncharacterized protein YecT (DUF1311 family)